MHNVGGHLRESERHQHLPCNRGGCVDEAYLHGYSHSQVQLEACSSRSSVHRVGRQKLASSGMQQVPPMAPGLGLSNVIWIAVSGYQLERAFLVHRFFLDIGPIVDRSFTATNLMYLKYACFTDCEIALSYDGQRIGYGGDILVSVKPENPVFESQFIDTTLERPVQAAVLDLVEASSHSSAACVIDMDAQTQPDAPQVAANTVANPTVLDMQIVPARKRSNYLQWLKHKISYFFYYY